MGMTAVRLRERRIRERASAPAQTKQLTDSEQLANAHAELAPLRRLVAEQALRIKELEEQVDQLTQPQQAETIQTQQSRGSDKRRGK